MTTDIKIQKINTNEVGTSKIVHSPKVARKLLKMGYHIIDIKPNKTYKKQSVFVFNIEGNFMQDYCELKEMYDNHKVTHDYAEHTIGTESKE